MKFFYSYKHHFLIFFFIFFFVFIISNKLIKKLNSEIYQLQFNYYLDNDLHYYLIFLQNEISEKLYQNTDIGFNREKFDTAIVSDLYTFSINSAVNQIDMERVFFIGSYDNQKLTEIDKIDLNLLKINKFLKDSIISDNISLIELFFTFNNLKNLENFYNKSNIIKLYLDDVTYYSITQIIENQYMYFLKNLNDYQATFEDRCKSLKKNISTIKDIEKLFSIPNINDIFLTKIKNDKSTILQICNKKKFYSKNLFSINQNFLKKIITQNQLLPAFTKINESSYLSIMIFTLLVSFSAGIFVVIVYHKIKFKKF